MRLILVVIAVQHAIRTESLWRQIRYLSFQVVGYGFDGAPHCVAPKPPQSNKTSAMAEPPTTLSCLSHNMSCHPVPQKQIGTPAQLREPTRTPLLYSRPVIRSPKKAPEGAKREEGGQNAVFFVGKPGHGAPLSP